MCKAVQDYTLQEQIRGAINAYKKTGMSEDDIVENVLKQYNVTEKYVRDLMHAAA